MGIKLNRAEKIIETDNDRTTHLVHFDVDGPEIDTLPGCTQTRLITQEFLAVGIRVESIHRTPSGMPGVERLEAHVATRRSDKTLERHGRRIAEAVGLIVRVTHMPHPSDGEALVSLLRRVSRSPHTPSTAHRWLASWAETLRMDIESGEAFDHQLIYIEKQLLAFVHDRLAVIRNYFGGDELGCTAPLEPTPIMPHHAAAA